jgi:hypothetical protein
VNLHNLATALRSANQSEAALMTFRAALRVQPRFAEALKAIALLDEEKKNGRLPRDEGSVWVEPAGGP